MSNQKGSVDFKVTRNHRIDIISNMTTHDTKSGLKESWHPLYKIPIVHQLNLQSISFGGDSPAIHSVPLAENRSLDFYAKLGASKELFVSLHGAVIAKTGRYPKFWRVMSMRNRVPAFIAVADPTLLLSDREDFCLGWYTGGPGWDPLDDISSMIRQAMTHVGATRVMFLGGSGGGFAALRLATRFPGSMAFIQEPQTSVTKYFQHHQKLLIDSCWPGESVDSAISANPDLFNMCHLYQTMDPDVSVYYRQSTGDPFHLENHLKPFQAAVQATQGMKAGLYEFVIEDGEVPGHGKITAEEFDFHFQRAMSHWENTSNRS